MIKLTNILKEIVEGKQVGTIYHFTSLRGILGILTDGFIRSNSENQLSVTRDKNIDINLLYSDHYDKGEINTRLDLDGDKISYRYKIRPFQNDVGFGYEDSPPAYLRKDEFEEQIITNGKSLPIYPYLKNVVLPPEESDEDHGLLDKVVDILEEKNIPYEIE